MVQNGRVLLAVLKFRFIYLVNSIVNGDLMGEKKGKKTKLIIATVTVIVLLVLALSIVLYNNLLFQQSDSGYWTLKISPTTGTDAITPNGTIRVPMNQAGINVTAKPHGWNGLMYWTLDGNGTQTGNSSITIFVPRQSAGSHHTLEAQFVAGTPPLTPLATKPVTIKAGTYKAYNFTFPSGTGQIIDIYNATVPIRVYVMNSANFTAWQNGQPTSSIYSAQASNGYIDNVVLPSNGTYYLIYDNTNVTTSVTVNSQANYFYIPP